MRPVWRREATQPPPKWPQNGATAAARMLTKRIKDMVGVSTEIIVGDPGEVERSQGKAKRVVDNRGKE